MFTFQFLCTPTKFPRTIIAYAFYSRKLEKLCQPKFQDQACTRCDKACRAVPQPSWLIRLPPPPPPPPFFIPPLPPSSWLSPYLHLLSATDRLCIHSPSVYSCHAIWRHNSRTRIAEGSLWTIQICWLMSTEMLAQKIIQHRNGLCLTVLTVPSFRSTPPPPPPLPPPTGANNSTQNHEAMREDVRLPATGFLPCSRLHGSLTGRAKSGREEREREGGGRGATS